MATALLPLTYIFLRASEKGSETFWDLVTKDRTIELALASLHLAAVVTAACLVLGVGFAWLVTRTDIPFRRALQVLLGLPLALPSYVAAFGWIGEFPGLAGRNGAALVLITISYPYVYIPVLAALRRCDPAVEDVARTLGLDPFTTFRKVVVPQIRTAALGGGLLVALYVLSDFGAVTLMRHQVLTSKIYESYNSLIDRTPAAAMGCVLAVLAILLVLAERTVSGRARRVGSGSAKVGGGSVRAPQLARLGRWRALVVLPIIWLFVAFGIPLRTLWQWWTNGSSRPDMDRLVETTLNTVQVSAIGAVMVIAVAFPVAVLNARYPSWWARFATATAYSGHALPGVVVGLSLVVFGVRVVEPIYQRLPLLILAYVVLFLSLALGSLQNALEQVPENLGHVARTLGRTSVGAWWSVTVRLAAPGMGAAATLVFLTIMKELPATLFLRPTDFDTLATQMWSHRQSNSRAASAPYALVIVALAALPTALLSGLGTRGRRTRTDEVDPS